jgi:hypothetical protein
MYGGGLWRGSFLIIVIQNDLGDSLRRLNGGKIGGKARGGGGGGVAFSWVVRGRLAGNGRTPLFSYEKFISSSCVYLYKNEKLLPGNSVSRSSNTRKASPPTSDHIQQSSDTGAKPLTEGGTPFGNQLAFFGCQVHFAGL